MTSNKPKTKRFPFLLGGYYGRFVFVFRSPPDRLSGMVVAPSFPAELF